MVRGRNWRRSDRLRRRVLEQRLDGSGAARMVKSAETGVSIEPFSGIRWTDGANSPPLCDFRANLDNFGRIDIVANRVGIVETGNVV